MRGVIKRKMKAGKDVIMFSFKIKMHIFKRNLNLNLVWGMLDIFVGNVA